MQLRTYDIAMRTRFRGITRRQGVLLRGAAGWGEWSPFLDYGGPELVPWLRAAREAADGDWPAPVRSRIPVNCTVPAVGPEQAYALVSAAGCGTAKVKVAEPGQQLADDLARVEAVRAALGVGGRVRVDANGGWDVDRAVTALGELRRFDLEYAEQPCASVRELAELRRAVARRGWSVPIAADESIRRAEDPYAVVRSEAADVAVLKVQPLGGVRACLRIAERIGLPVVVSSALETAIGIRAGLALAAALPEQPYAAGLNTGALLTDDPTGRPLGAVGGVLIHDPAPVTDLDTEASDRCAADPATDAWWRDRLAATLAVARTDREPAR